MISSHADSSARSSDELRVFTSQRLRRLSSKIQQICDISGVAGASVGVLYEGHVLHRDNFGWQDVDAQIPTTSQTVYGIGSMTKAFVAAGIGKLVDEGCLSWDTPVKDILPEFSQLDACLTKMITASDLLSHQTGLSGSLSLAFQGDGEVLLSQDQLFPVVNNLAAVGPFRGGWIYNNWGYALAGVIIERLSKRTMNDFLKTAIFEPLGLNCTTTQPQFEDGSNIAKPYAALEDGSTYHLPNRQQFKDTFFESAGGAYSNVDDLLVWAGEVLKASRSSKSLEISPLRNIPMTLSNQIPMINPSLTERSYGMGWARARLPGIVGLLGDNGEILPFDKLPILGRGSQSRLILYHQGSTVGYYSAIFLDPQTDSAVVVLTNSIAIGDAADWISQSLMQSLIHSSEPIDYVQKALEVKETLLGLYGKLSEDIAKTRNPATKRKCLEPYVGDYYNNLGNFVISIRESKTNQDALVLSFQGKEAHSFELRHQEHDVFEWSMSFNETAKRGRYHIWDPTYFKIAFRLDENTAIQSLTWVEDPFFMPQGQIFVRKENQHLARPKRKGWWQWILQL